MQGAEPRMDPGFGIDVKWDVPLLDGYAWVSLPNRSLVPKADSFFGLINPGIWGLISGGKFDVVVLFTGYVCASFWIALAAAKWNRVPVFLGPTRTNWHHVTTKPGRSGLKNGYGRDSLGLPTGCWLRRVALLH